MNLSVPLADVGSDVLVLNGALAVFAVGVLGGAAVEALKWYQLKEDPEWPAYARSPRYWIITAVMILLGGGLALLYGTTDKSAILVFNLGAAAPAVIRAVTPPVSTSRRRRRARREVAPPAAPQVDHSVRGFLAA